MALSCLMALCLAAIFSIAGCNDIRRSPRDRFASTSEDANERSLAWVVENITSLNEIEDSPTLEPIRDRLNQWIQAEEFTVDWQLDPLLRELPKELQSLPSFERLASLEFSVGDVAQIQHAHWMRDVGNQARGGEADELAIALRLFDWTVRNLQLSGDELPAAPHLVGSVLLNGKATVFERAWVFIHLARQQGITAVILAVGQPSSAKFWLPAVLIGDELYLFEARLGLPILGADGQTVATLRQVVADPSLLRALDLDAEHPYPVLAADLAHLSVWIEASPVFAAKRMKYLESKLVGQNRVRLSTDPSTLAERLRRAQPFDAVAIWLYPYEQLKARNEMTAATRAAAALELAPFRLPLPEKLKKSRFAEPTDFQDLSEGLSVQSKRSDERKQSATKDILPLKLGRLAMFRGSLSGPTGATRMLQTARPDELFFKQLDSADKIAQDRTGPAADDLRRQLAMVRNVARECQLTASLWLGQMMFADGAYESALHFFKQAAANGQSGPWTDAARYNQARTHEAVGQLAEAIKIYESDRSPQNHGNRLRARRLAAQPAGNGRGAETLQSEAASTAIKAAPAEAAASDQK